MEYKLYKVADAIMDSAAEEYRAENLASIEAVQQYASGGMGVALTRAEAQLIRVISLRMIGILASEKIPSTQDWYAIFEAPLKEV